MKYEQDQDMRGSVLYPAPSKISLECLTRLRSNRTYSILARHTRVGLINPYVLTSTLQLQHNKQHHRAADQKDIAASFEMHFDFLTTHIFDLDLCR